MNVIAFYSVAIILLGLSLIFAIAINFTRKKRIGIIKRSHCLIVGVFVSSAILFMPMYVNYFGDQSIGLRTVLLSVHNAIRLFVVDADFELVSSFVSVSEATIASAYEITLAILYVLAPCLTATFLLMLFGDTSSYIKLFCSFYKEAYVFSDLNETSLALAKDITKNKKRALIVFVDVLSGNDESNDLIDKAKELGAVIFKKSIAYVHFNIHLNVKPISFFAIGNNEDENVSHSYELIKKYGKSSKKKLYLFSKTKQSELFIDSIDKNCKMKIKRVKESSSLINRYLYDNGKDIFNGTHATEDGLKVISAVVLGMGYFGTEMAKALPWFCQLPGYRFKLNVFDMDEKAESKFKVLCPEYLNPKCNRVYVDGEAQYDINVHSGVDFNTFEFGEQIQKIKDASFVFVALGSDEENIACAVKARMYFERIGVHPKIVAVVFDGDKVKQIKNAVCGSDENAKEYDIDYTGTLEELYSYNVIINSELEERALKVHMRWPAKDKSLEEHEKGFWTNEYNYNSSCASAIHQKVRVECKISGADKKEEDLTDEERDIITLIEHRRWNTQVRSCGYIYSGSKEKASRSDLGKLHNCLIPFEELSDEYKQMDTDIGVTKE